MQHNIECMSWDEEADNRQWEITIDSKVWPCCIFVIDAYPYFSNELLMTTEFMELYAKDPNWNSLHHHSLEEIQSYPFYTEIVHPKGWESDNPPNMCAKYCGGCGSVERKAGATDMITK